MKIKKEQKTQPKKPIFRNAVFAVTYKKENGKIEYLILKRKLHWIGWEFPKGGVEKNENTKAAVRREVYEESGNRAIKISSYPVKGKYHYKKMFPDRPGTVGQFYSLWSAEIPSDSKIRIDSREHSAYLWLPFNEAMQKLTFDNQKKSLSFVNKILVK